MPKLIQKSGYLKSGGRGAGRYMEYIATREGVEIAEERQPELYMKYIAERPRSHGLFSSDNSVSLEESIKQVSSHPGSVWTIIYSLKREDAARLGYDRAESWRKLLQAHQVELAEAMKIPPNSFRWYAAFHDEEKHPHIHMMVWSDNPKQGYLTEKGIEKMRSVMTNQIFQDELLSLYQEKDLSYKEVTAAAHKAMRELTRQMESSLCDSPVIEQRLMELAGALADAKGKKVYGYLKKPTKALVDSIVDELEKLPAVAECYEVWNCLRDEVDSYYKDAPRERLPLSRQKEFKAIKNAVIREAENIRLGVATFEDEGLREMEGAEDDVDFRSLTVRYSDLWLTAQDDTAVMEDREAAAQELEQLAETGNPYAQYLTGKLYRDGPALIPDWVNARYWFEQASDQLPAAQYALGELLLTNAPEVRDPELAMKWLELAARNGSQWAAYRLGKEYIKGENVAKNVPRAMEYLEQSAQAGNQFAQYALGKLYLTEQDGEQAQYWFSQSASQGNQYAQFFLDRWDSPSPPSVMLSVTRLLYHMSRVFQDAPAPHSGGGLHIDRKRLAQLREKKIAMGHKPDDHEEVQNWGSMTMG